MFDFCKRHLPVSDSNLKVLKEDDETNEGAMFVSNSSTLSCHFGKKPKTIFVITCKQQTNKNEKK